MSCGVQLLKHFTKCGVEDTSPTVRLLDSGHKGTDMDLAERWSFTGASELTTLQTRGKELVQVCVVLVA